MAAIDDILKGGDALGAGRSTTVTRNDRSQPAAIPVGAAPSSPDVRVGEITMEPAQPVHGKTNRIADKPQVPLRQDGKFAGVSHEWERPADTYTGTATPQQQATETPQLPITKYTDLFERLNQGRAPETVEQRKKRERSEKWARVATAIGRGVGAIANMHYTTKGGLNIDSSPLTAKTQERLDKLKAEREANEKYYTEGMMRAAQADEALNNNERSWRNMLQQQAEARKRDEEQQAYGRERDKKNDEFREREYNDRRADKGKEDEWRQKNFDYQAGQDKFRNGILAQQAADSHAERVARQNAAAAAAGKGKGTAAAGSYYPVKTNYGTIAVPSSMLNDANAARLWNAIPADIRKTYGTPGTNGSRAAKREDILSALGVALSRKGRTPAEQDNLNSLFREVVAMGAAGSSTPPPVNKKKK